MWRVWLPVGITWSIIDRDAFGVVAPCAIIRVASVFTLRAFVTVSKVHVTLISWSFRQQIVPRLALIGKVKTGVTHPRKYLFLNC